MVYDECGRRYWHVHNIQANTFVLRRYRLFVTSDIVVYFVIIGNLRHVSRAREERIVRII